MLYNEDLSPDIRVIKSSKWTRHIARMESWEIVTNFILKLWRKLTTWET